MGRHDRVVSVLSDSTDLALPVRPSKVRLVPSTKDRRSMAMGRAFVILSSNNRSQTAWMCRFGELFTWIG